MIHVHAVDRSLPPGRSDDRLRDHLADNGLARHFFRQARLAEVTGHHRDVLQVHLRDTDTLDTRLQDPASVDCLQERHLERHFVEYAAHRLAVVALRCRGQSKQELQIVVEVCERFRVGLADRVMAIVDEVTVHEVVVVVLDLKVVDKLVRTPTAERPVERLRDLHRDRDRMPGTVLVHHVHSGRQRSSREICGLAIWSPHVERMVASTTKLMPRSQEQFKHLGRDPLRGSQNLPWLDRVRFVVPCLDHVAWLDRLDRSTVNQRPGRKALVDERRPEIVLRVFLVPGQHGRRGGNHNLGLSVKLAVRSIVRHLDRDLGVRDVLPELRMRLGDQFLSVCQEQDRTAVEIFLRVVTFPEPLGNAGRHYGLSTVVSCGVIVEQVSVIAVDSKSEVLFLRACWHHIEQHSFFTGYTNANKRYLAEKRCTSKKVVSFPCCHFPEVI